MRRTTRLPELLAPAGDFECLVAAVEAGADAVYVGAKRFSARAYAKNFDSDELARAVVYCHLHGVKLFVTVNTLFSTAELADALALAGELYSIGVDAVIAADLGFIREVRHAFPELEIHASTQLSVHNTPGADEACKLGCKRVVLARELSRDSIESVVNSSLAECEVFLHGALCVSHSGQCLFSSLVGGRSGNRGECAQPCRLNYNGGKYPLSLKDLCLADHIPELISLGVSSLKIEGRMKSPDYVYTVTSVYRALLDECRRPTEKERELLQKAFSRSGFTDGYFIGRTEKGMTGVRTDGDISATRNMQKLTFTPKRVPVSASLSVKRGEPSVLTLTLGERTATVVGPVPEEARSAPLAADDLVSRICKMGNTFFSLEKSAVTVTLDEGLNLSPAAINTMRRAAVSELEGAPKAISAPALSTPARLPLGNIGKTALFLRPELVNELPSSALSELDAVIVPLFSDIPRAANGVYLPPVITDGELREVREALADLRERGIRYALVGNIGHIPLVGEAGLVPIGDFRFNIYNSHAKAALAELGVSDTVLSCELGDGAVRSIGGRAVVYGRIPLMLTERCFGRELYGCSACGSSMLRDRRGESFPVLREWKHRCLVLNSRVTYMADKLSELKSRGTVAEHYIFSTEGSKEAQRVILAYKNGEKCPPSVQYRRMGRREAD